MGEYNRAVESGYEQRIPIEKIVLHKNYENFLHDLVLMKLSMPADLTKKSNIRRICLPFLFNDPTMSYEMDDDEYGHLAELEDPLQMGLLEVPDKMENFLRSVQSIRKHRNFTMPTMKDLMDLKIMQRLKRIENAKRLQQSWGPGGLRGNRARKHGMTSANRRNDKFMKIFQYTSDYVDESEQKHRYIDNNRDLPYIDCVATGWGKANVTGDLTDLLLKTAVPLHNNRR